MLYSDEDARSGIKIRIEGRPSLSMVIRAAEFLQRLASDMAPPIPNYGAKPAGPTPLQNIVPFPGVRPD